VSRHAHHRAPFWRGALALAAVAGLGTLAACGSSAGGSSASGSSASASKSPIKIGIAVPIKSVVDFSESVAAAKGAARAVNKAGGVDGHPLQIVACNTQLNPNQELSCARTLIGDHVAATVGDSDYTNEKTANALYRSAGVAQIGDTPAGFSESDPNSYLFWGGQNYVNAAEIYAAAKWGGGKVGTVRLDDPFTAPVPAFWKAACQAEGCQIVSQAVVPSNTVTDYSPYAEQLVSGHPSVIAADLGPGLQPLMTALDQLGYTGQVADQDTNLTARNFLSQAAKVQDQYINIAPFPPPFASSQFPGIKQYLSEMQAERAAGDASAPGYLNDSQATTMDAWLGVHVFAEIAGPAHATDATSFKAAIDKATDVSLLGLAPNWDPTKVDLARLPRVSLDAWYFYTYVNGKPKLLNTKPAAMTDLVKKAFG
jgi:branched-chain amino acid transport system substrate-binding protein